MRIRARVDRNQEEIVTVLRSLGVRVVTLHTVGKGFPDLLCLYMGQLRLLEVKVDKEPLTEAERQFHQLWPVSVVRSAQEALEVMGISYV